MTYYSFIHMLGINKCWNICQYIYIVLTHWGRVTHICVSKLHTIGSDNGLSPGRRQAIIRTNAGILLIRTLGTNFSDILGEIHSFSFSKMHLKMSSAKWRLFGLGLNELINVLVMKCRPQCTLTVWYQRIIYYWSVECQHRPLSVWRSVVLTRYFQEVLIKVGIYHLLF